MSNDKKSNSRSIEINLGRLFSAILKKLWLIILAAIVVCGAAVIGTKLFVKETYRSSFTAYINNQQAQLSKEYLSSSDLIASKELVQTYSKILTSNRILTASMELMKKDYTYSRISKMVFVETTDDTEIISFSAVAHTPDEAYNIATAVAKTAPGYMADIIEGSSMKIIDNPEIPEKRYSPQYTRIAVFAFLIGAFISMAIVIILYFLDDTVKTQEDLESRIPIPVVGVIPDMNMISSGGNYYYYNKEDTAYMHTGSEKGDSSDG